MSRKQPRPQATIQLRLEPFNDRCRECGQPLWVAYHNFRTIATLDGLLGLRLVVRRCVNGGCQRYHRPYRPEEEGAFALPQGTLRPRRHRFSWGSALCSAPQRP
jgi:hypothetical protein